MRVRPRPTAVWYCLVTLLACLAYPTLVMAQDAKTFRQQYSTALSNFASIYAAQGNSAGQERVSEALAALQSIPDAQLATLYGLMGAPDAASLVAASSYLTSRAQSAPSLPLAPQPKTPGFPSAPDLLSNCIDPTIPLDSAGRYFLLIDKEVANSILAAAAWVCNEDILGENGSLACVPLAIAADIANGFFDTATFCAGEFTANQVDGNYNRLDHIHNDLAGVQATSNALDTHLTNIDTHLSNIDTHIANEFSLLDTHLSNVDTHIANEFSLLDTHLGNVDTHIANEFSLLDTHLTNVDTHITNEFAALDAHMVSLFNTLAAQLTNSTALLAADLKQVMKLELTPEGQRQIVPAILTCTGTNCPDVLAHCTGTGGACSWNNVGPLP